MNCLKRYFWLLSSLSTITALELHPANASQEWPLHLGKGHAQHINCVVIEDARAAIVQTNAEGKDSLIDVGVPADVHQQIRGPVELRFRMKTSVHGELGEYIVYWVTGDQTKWKAFQRIPLIPDGEWHDYRLPLSDRGQIKALRLTFGKQKHELALAELRLAPAAEAPATGPEGLPLSIEVEAGSLSLTLNTENHTYSILDRTTGRTWRSEPVSEWLAITEIQRESESVLSLGLYDRFAGTPLNARVELTNDRTARFTLTPTAADAPIEAARHYPPRFATDMQEGHFVFCDRSCGVLLDQRDETYAAWPLRVYGNTHCLDMPWVGLYDEQRSDGLMLLVETPADAEVAFVAGEDGRHWPEVRWLPSMDTFRYPRTASLRFADQGGYVALAQRYRAYLQEQGRLVTLAEKAQRKPAVARLRGAPSLWGGRYPTKFLRQMRPLGLTTGIIGTVNEPALVDWFNKLGYLTGRYDNYTDFTEGRTRFLVDRKEESALVPRPGGAAKHGWKKRSGEQMYWRSSARWKNTEDKYVPRELSRIPYSSRFIDVAAASELLEDFHPEHTFDRREDLANRKALFQRMNDRGLVLGTEHGNDWVADQVEYFEGSMSGPFWWSSWGAGYLDRPKREQLTENYLKYGMGYAHRVPLWELVYHDCAVTTWYWGDTAGLLYDAAPELSDRKDLFNLLYGTTPLFWMNDTGYRMETEVHRMLRTFHGTCQMHKAVAFEQMSEHRFLSEDRSLQLTRFANGTVAVVNFSDKPQNYSADGGDVLVAPLGFYVKGPEFSQTKLWVEDIAQTVIKKPGYLTVESDGSQPLHGVKCGGRVTTFRTADDRWNLFLDPSRPCEIDIPSITDWDPQDNLRVCYMDDLGDIKRVAAAAGSDGVVRFASTENAWRFALLRDKPEARVAEAPGSQDNE